MPRLVMPPGYRAATSRGGTRPRAWGQEVRRSTAHEEPSWVFFAKDFISVAIETASA